MSLPFSRYIASAAMFVTLGGCAAAQAEAPRATPASEVQSPAQNDDIAELIARMSLEHKVGS